MKTSIILFSLFCVLYFECFSEFPSKIPLEKPTFEISPAVERLYDNWNPHEDRENELFSCVVLFFLLLESNA